MAFAVGNVVVPASGGTPVLVYQAPDGVPTNLVLVGNTNIILLDDVAQSPTNGCELLSAAVPISGLIGAVYAICSTAYTNTLSFAASNIA